MSSRFGEGDTAWIVESNRSVRKVYIVRSMAGFYIVMFTDSDTVIQVRGGKLYNTEEAQKSIS